MPKFVHHYPVNHFGRTFVTGDLHGCYSQLMSLLQEIGFDFGSDVLYQTGDLIDRGAQSRQCLDQIGKRWFRPVKGNHDDLLIEAADDHLFDWAHWQRHGGGWAKHLTREELRHYANLLRSLPYVITVSEGENRFNVFHGEWHGSDEELDAIEARRYPPLHLIGGRDLIEGRVDKRHHEGRLSPSFVGHTQVRDIKMIGSHIYMDTSAYMAEFRDTGSYGLSIMEVATQQVWKYQRQKMAA